MSPYLDQRMGLAAALGAFGLWGLAPIYFKFLGQTAPDEIIAHRVVWALIFLGMVLVIRHRRSLVMHVRISPKTLMALMLSGSLIVINWLLFVFAVNTDRVLLTSLGYYINPLVSVLFGLLLFRERLAPIQSLAVVIAAVGTVYMAVRVGHFPWIALGLATTFALYSVVRKVTDVGPMVGLFWETLLVSPFALAWLAVLAGQQRLDFDPAQWGLALVLAGTGLVTVVPLLLFAAGVRRLPLSTIGVMQYLAPSVTFMLAVLVYGEPFSVDHAVTFACIWTALVLFSWSGWVRARKARLAV